MKYIKIILITLLTLTNLNVIKAEDKNIVSIKIVYFQNEEYIIFQGQENNPINIYNIKIS